MTEEEYKTDSNNNNNSIINISLSSIILYSGIIIFMWFAFQTMFQVLYHNIIREYEEEDNKLTNEELKILKELLK